MLRTTKSLVCGATVLLLLADPPAGAADPERIPAPVVDSATLPPAIGPAEPRVAAVKGEDGLYHQTWFPHSFLDLREDFAEARAAGKRFAVIFEQRGCVYCVKMHKEVLAKRYINDYVDANFRIVQMNLWGDRETTDFDGKTMTEKELAERWGVLFTPTVVFFKEDIAGAPGQAGRDLEVARMSLGIGANTFYDMFVWVREKVYLENASFQRFHLQRYHEREAMRAKAGKAKKRSSTSVTN